MIKTEILTKIVEQNTEIPSHWRIINTDDYSLPSTRRIIPMGNGNQKFKKLLIDSINDATSHVMLCSFLLSDQDIIDSLLKASDKGVRCYLMFSTEAQLSKEYKEEVSDFDLHVLNKHKEMLDKLAGKALTRTSDHLHAKFLLIDVGTEKEEGYMSTANFTQEALTRNEEVGIVLKKTEIKTIAHFFNVGFWEESKNELIRKGSWDDVRNLDIKTIESNSEVVFTTSKDRGMKERIKEIIVGADNELLVSSFGFGENNDLVKLLIKHSEQRKLSILTRPREKTHNFLSKIEKENTVAYAFPFLHVKMILDPAKRIGIIMTANFEDRGMETGYEVGIVVQNEDFDEALHIFQNWIESASMMWNSSTKLSFLDEGLIRVPKGRSLEQKEVKNYSEIDMPQEKPNDLRLMQKLVSKTLEYEVKKSDILIKEMRLKKEILPPRLPESAQEVIFSDLFLSKKQKSKGEKLEFKFPFKTYLYQGQYYVVIKKWADLERISSFPDFKKHTKIVIK